VISGTRAGGGVVFAAAGLERLLVSVWSEAVYGSKSFPAGPKKWWTQWTRNRSCLRSLERLLKATIRGVVSVISASRRHGSDGKGKDGFPGFIFYLATKHPKAAARIVEKILPLTIKGDGLAGPSISTINVVSVPSGSFLTKEELAKFAPPSLREIEQDIVREHTNEPPQLEHTSEPQPTPPELLELLEQADAPVLAEVLQELLERKESELIDEHEAKTMFSRAALRVPRKPSWAVD
jgi:hypothetical protein